MKSDDEPTVANDDDARPEDTSGRQTDAGENKPAPSQYPSALPPSHYDKEDD